MKQKLLFSATILVATTIYSQDLNTCISLLNSGRLQECVDCIDRVLQERPDNTRGVPLYYKAECLYALSLAGDVPDRIGRLRTAVNLFNQALNQADLQTGGYSVAAAYKKGWSWFRIGELENNAEAAAQAFDNAVTSFAAVPENAQDFFCIAQYMIGEAKIAKLRLKSLEFFDRLPGALSEQEFFGTFDQARAAFERAEKSWRNTAAPESFKVLAQARAFDAALLKGLGYLTLGNGPNALRELNNADYSRLALPAAAPIELREAVTYSEAIRQLYFYWLNRDSQSLQRFAELMSSLTAVASQSEKNFRLGNADQAKAPDNPSFSNLASPAGYYGSSAASIPEAFFWKGVVQYVLDRDNEALASLSQFVQAAPRTPTLRQKRLLEQTQLFTFQLRLRRAMAAPSSAARSVQLQNLINDINSFSSRNPIIYQEREKLLLWAKVARRIAQGGDRISVLADVYNYTGGAPDQALLFVKEIMPFTAQVVAQERRYYLNIIDILLQFTERDFPQETRFLRGIYYMMSAEIAPNDTEARADYQRAVDSFSNPDLGSFQGEAAYIRARAMFFGKFFRNIQDAENSLRPLINDKQSVRSLYLLAEFYRTFDPPEPGKAAACYQAVLRAVSNNPEARFWKENAEEGLRRVGGGSGDMDAIQRIGLAPERVIFPDVLSRDRDGRPVQYEFLADTKFLQQRRAEDAFNLLIKFGLPKKSLYPSENLLTDSWLVKEGVWDQIRMPINERLGAVTAGIKLFVATEGGAPVVSFNGMAQSPKSDGSYEAQGMDMGSAVNIRVEAAGHYPRLYRHVFSRPQTDTVFIALTAKQSFQPTGKINKDENSVVGFDQRFDRNILFAGNRLPDRNSSLFKCLAESLYVRDLVKHPDGFFLVVDAAGNKILRFDDENQPWESAQEIRLVFPADIFPNTLKSPEGIAVDSEGNLYIADWGNHRILMAQKNGQVIKSLGSYGRERTIGAPIQLVYPTRLAVSEDQKGITFNGKTILRGKLIYVADFDGVHVIDTDGIYLDTVIKPDRVFPQGSFYALKVDGYGSETVLQLADREKGGAALFIAR